MPQQFPQENRISGHARAESSQLSRVAQKLSQLDTQSLLALVDQGVVSAMSLIASVIVGRYCGADGLGIYSLAISIIILFIGLHTAVVSTPYTVFRTRINAVDEKSFAGSSIFSSLLVILLGIVLLLVTSTVFYIFKFIPSFEFVILTLAALLPFLIMREFARRFAFAHLNMGSAVAIDATVAVIQISALLLLARFELLTPANALVCLGGACGIGALVWFFGNRGRFMVDRRFLKANLSRKWDFGRWLMLENMLGMVGTYITPWLLIFLIDSTATGIFAACMIIVNLSSPFLQGMGNSLSPKFAVAASGNSIDPIRQLFTRATLFMTGAMVVFVLICFFAGEAMMQVLYKESEYRGYGLIVTILAIRAMCGAANISAHHAILAMEKPLPSLYCSLFGLIGTAVGGLILIPMYEILGGAIAMLIGTMIEVIAIYWGYILVLGNFSRSVETPVEGQVQT